MEVKFPDEIKNREFQSFPSIFQIPARFAMECWRKKAGRSQSPLLDFDVGAFIEERSDERPNRIMPSV